MIIIDASVAIKWFQSNEKDSKIALTLYDNHMTELEMIMVPSLLFIEIGNHLARNSQYNTDDIQSWLNLLYDAKLKIYPITEKDITEATTLAKAHQTTLYDMLYAVIAKNKGIDLITADEKFVKKCSFKYVKLLSEV